MNIIYHTIGFLSQRESLAAARWHQKKWSFGGQPEITVGSSNLEFPHALPEEQAGSAPEGKMGAKWVLLYAELSLLWSSPVVVPGC